MSTTVLQQQQPSGSDASVQNMVETDDFEQFLNTQQLPFYQTARQRILAHGRLIIRVNFLDKCASESLAPAEIVYHPTPPQGIDMKPTEIGIWKSTIAQCE